MKVEKGSTNVYADLGMADAEEMLIKAQLVTKIRELLKGRKLVQREAAELLGIKQPRLSNMLRGDFRGISERKMLDCLTRLGNDVRVVVQPVAKTQSTGKFSLVFAGAASPHPGKAPAWAAAR